MGSGKSTGAAKRSHAVDKLLAEIRACRICEAHLPLGPRPVLQASATSRLLIVSQAPGRKVHETGIPFNDVSGDRLREWLGIDKATFYDASRIAIVPMGFCFPGQDAKGGDLPPQRRCAPLWHPKLRPLLPWITLTLLVGSYAQAYYLGTRRQPTLDATVRAWQSFLPDFLPLPHPSWRNTGWLKKHPWFETELLPVLRRRVAELTTLSSPCSSRGSRVSTKNG